ncbi:transposase [Bradyrhizobium sp. LM3.2]
MIALRSDPKVVLATQPVDFRKSVHTLSALVSEALRANPYCGDVFVFRSKRMDRVKLLAWDGSGMVLVTKWLHQGRFTWPPIRDGVIHLSATQLATARRARVDACVAEACEAAGARRMTRVDFAGGCGVRMYRLIMAIRPDALPTDTAALTEMVLALDAENEKLRWRCSAQGDDLREALGVTCGARGRAARARAGRSGDRRHTSCAGQRRCGCDQAGW